MKKQNNLLLILFLLTSCSKTFIQIFDIASTDVQTKNEYFVYENDSVKITYAFWTRNGVMSFSVFNKTKKPIYIDWKNSSFIYNGNKLDYWSDEIQTISQSNVTSITNKNTKISSYYNGYYYVGTPIIWEYTNNQSYILSQSLTAFQTETQSSSFKPERITFIPPKSAFSCSRFYLFPADYYKLNVETATQITLPRNDKPKRNTTVYSESFFTKHLHLYSEII